MEFGQVVKFFKRRGFPVLLLSFTAAVVSGIISAKLPPAFEASQTIFVRREVQPPSDAFYVYDGYYSQQAVERYTDTVIGFLKNSDTIRQASGQSGLGNRSVDVQKITSRFKVKRSGPQLVTISFSDPDRGKASAFISNITKRVRELSASLNSRGDKYLDLSVIESEPFLGEKRFSPLIVSPAVFILVGLSLIFLFSVIEGLGG